ncbi:MAG: HU family DNA-binding protein [Cytophagaceae bacterium]|jgi:predicted histone-like DNA-binding protein|nr:HU family DNA-binding protein [Cytophagaceae bacterium]
MAFKYRVKTKRSGLGDKAAKYYAVPIHSREISSEQLAFDLAQRSSLSEGDVLATLVGLSSLVKQYLHDGHTVRLDGLGLLSVSASSDGFNTLEECTPRHVKAKKICFRATRELKADLKYIRFEREK